MLAFTLRHLEAVFQFAVTFWLASIARSFQVSMSIYGTRLETHREAIRRSQVLWWLKKDATDWLDTMNEMHSWLLVNEVFLTPAAAQGFRDIRSWKEVTAMDTAGEGYQKEFRAASEGGDILRTELLRFRKRTFGEMVGDAWHSVRRRRKRRP